jgi:lysophospholipase L1-like esterase
VICRLPRAAPHYRRAPPIARALLGEVVEAGCARQLSHDHVAWLDLNDRADVLQADMFMDPIHLDARGNAAMADVLAPVLEASLRQFESRSTSAPAHGR